MGGSIFGKTRDFLSECAKSEGEQSHSLKLTQKEFEAFKAVFVAAAISHSYAASKSRKSEFNIERVVENSTNDLMLEGPSIAARLSYDPKTQTMTLAGDKLPWKSLEAQLKIVNAQVLGSEHIGERNRTWGRKPEAVVAVLCDRAETAQTFGAILVTLAREKGLDFQDIETSSEATPAVPVPFVSVPREMYDTLRQYELLPGNGLAARAV